MAQELNLRWHDVVLKSFLGCREAIPKGQKVGQLPTINRDHPIVWEVLVADLAHFSLALVQDAWHEWQQAEDD